MKTHEVEQLLGLTKQTLIYYEKEDLIHPQRDENNYRDYSQDDIDMLRFIQLLRSMAITIDEIKLILNHQLSIRDVLETKKEFIEYSKTKLGILEQKIKDYIKRREVKISFDDQIIENHPSSNTLFFNSQSIKYNQKQIPINEIKKIEISMCSVNTLQTVILVFFNYYVDIDIYTNQDVYSFQIMNDNQVLSMFRYFQKQEFSIIDPLNLMTLYQEKQDEYIRYKYLDRHFKDWAKEYHLDNPRGNYFQWRLEYMDEFKEVKQNDDSLDQKEKSHFKDKWQLFFKRKK